MGAGDGESDEEILFDPESEFGGCLDMLDLADDAPSDDEESRCDWEAPLSDR